MSKIIVRGAALTVLRQADFSCHIARRGAPTAAKSSSATVFLAEKVTALQCLILSK